MNKECPTIFSNQSAWQLNIVLSDQDSCPPIPEADYTHQWSDARSGWELSVQHPLGQIFLRQDVREPHCALAGHVMQHVMQHVTPVSVSAIAPGANVSWDGALAFITAEYISSEEIRCDTSPQAMTMRWATVDL